MAQVALDNVGVCPLVDDDAGACVAEGVDVVDRDLGASTGPLNSRRLPRFFNRVKSRSLTGNVL